MTPYKPYTLYLDGKFHSRHSTPRKARLEAYTTSTPYELYEIYLRRNISRWDRSKGRLMMTGRRKPDELAAD